MADSSLQRVPPRWATLGMSAVLVFECRKCLQVFDGCYLRICCAVKHHGGQGPLKVVVEHQIVTILLWGPRTRHKQLVQIREVCSVELSMSFVCVIEAKKEKLEAVPKKEEEEEEEELTKWSTRSSFGNKRGWRQLNQCSVGVRCSLWTKTRPIPGKHQKWWNRGFFDPSCCQRVQTRLFASKWSCCWSKRA